MSSMFNEAYFFSINLKAEADNLAMTIVSHRKRGKMDLFDFKPLKPVMQTIQIELYKR